MPPKAIKSWGKADNGTLANLIRKQGRVAIKDHSIADIEAVHIEINFIGTSEYFFVTCVIS
jgi:hypothetical protein